MEDNSVKDFNVVTTDGKNVSMKKDFKWKLLLIVNIARNSKYVK